MYGNCIFCSAPFGTNESLESFPVGAQLAFDGWKGRLWTVCPLCGRWNLAPIEERWEAVEEAEKLFRDARLRVQSENMGLARLPDGTRLVRVGEAVSGELAAWRYGTQLLRRRKRYYLLAGGAAVATAGVYGGVTAVGGGAMTMWLGWTWVQNRWQQKVLYRVPSDADPAGDGVVIRRWQLAGVSLHATFGGELGLVIRDAHRDDPDWRGEVDRDSADVLVVSGEHATALLTRAMVHVNRSGASRDTLREANRILADAGSAESILREAAAGGAALGSKAGRDPEVLKGPGALAVEMALNESAEREALEGELAALRRAWQEAEEIAAIADRLLPGEAALNRVLQRLAR